MVKKKGKKGSIRIVSKLTKGKVRIRRILKKPARQTIVLSSGRSLEQGSPFFKQNNDFI